MGDAGLSIPSESWLDAVTREAMQGREYVLDVATSRVEQADDPDLGEALKDAPAPLPAWPTAATVRLSPEDEPRTYPVSSGACDAKATAPRARPTLIALAALALAHALQSPSGSDGAQADTPVRLTSLPDSGRDARQSQSVAGGTSCAS